MFRRSLAVFVSLALLGAGPPPPPPRQGPPKDFAQGATAASAAFTVTGIDLDVAGKTADAARLAAFREAQRRAWPLLWTRLTGNPASGAPRLGDSALDAMVAGIDIEAERFSATRWIGRLGVAFDGARAAQYLGSAGRGLASPPMLLLPVLDDGGARVVYEAQSPWLKAWARYRGAASPIQYVRASTVAGDAIMLNAWQARRSDRTLWRNAMARFRTSDVLTAEARLDRRWPGGPVTGLFTARYGPDATPLGRFKLSVRSDAQLPTLLDAGVRRIDALYTNALRAGLLKPDPGLRVELETAEVVAPTLAVVTAEASVEALLPTPDAAALNAVQAALRGAPTVTGSSIASLSLGGTSRLRIGYSDSYDWLLYGLDQRGWRLQPVQGGLLLRKRAAGETPIPRPVTADDLEAAEDDLPVAPAASPAKPAAVKPPPAKTKGPADLLPPQAR